MNFAAKPGFVYLCTSKSLFTRVYELIITVFLALAYHNINIIYAIIIRYFNAWQNRFRFNGSLCWFGRSNNVDFTCNHKLTYLSSHPKCLRSFKTINYHCMTIFKRLHAGKQLKKVPTNNRAVYKWWCIHSRRWKREQSLRYRKINRNNNSIKKRTLNRLYMCPQISWGGFVSTISRWEEKWSLRIFFRGFKWDFLDCRAIHRMESDIVVNASLSFDIWILLRKKG